MLDLSSSLRFLPTDNLPTMGVNFAMPASKKLTLVNVSVYVITQRIGCGIACHVLKLENNDVRASFSFVCYRGRAQLNPGESWEHRFMSLSSAQDTMKSVVLTDAWVGGRHLSQHEVKLGLSRQEVGPLEGPSQGTVTSVLENVELDFTRPNGPVRIYLSVYVATPFLHELKVENNDTTVGFTFHCNRGRAHLNPGDDWSHSFVNGKTAVKTMESLVATDAWVNNRRLTQDDIELYFVRRGVSTAARIEARAQRKTSRHDFGVVGLDFGTPERVPIFLSVYVASPLHHVVKLENNDTRASFSFYCSRGRAKLSPGESWQHPFVNGSTAVSILKSVVIADAWVGSRHLREHEIELRFMRQDVSLPARMQACMRGQVSKSSLFVTLDLLRANQAK